MPHGLLIFIVAAGSGAAFALIGIAYRLGHSRRIAPATILMFASAMGLVFFLLRARGLDWRQVPERIWVMGIAAGLTQYLALKLLRLAMANGPFSPAWCAASLSFVPVVVYASGFLRESMQVWQYLSVAAAVLAMVVASAGEQDGGQADAPAGLGRNLFYCAVLLAVLFVNGVASVCMKDLGVRALPAGGSYMHEWGSVFCALLYLFIVLGVASERLLERRLGAPLLPTLGLGLLAGCGSVSGIAGMVWCSQAKSSMPFPVSGVVQILAAAVVSVVFFRERVTGRWVATMALGVAAVLLAPIGYNW